MWKRFELYVAVAIAEVKYFTSEGNDRRSAIRAAIDRIVRYVRGYRDEAGWDDLPNHSLAIPVLCDVSLTEPRSFGVPWIVDFNLIQSQALDHWSRAFKKQIKTALILPNDRRDYPRASYVRLLIVNSSTGTIEVTNKVISRPVFCQ